MRGKLKEISISIRENCVACSIAAVGSQSEISRCLMRVSSTAASQATSASQLTAKARLRPQQQVSEPSSSALLFGHLCRMSACYRRSLLGHSQLILSTWSVLGRTPSSFSTLSIGPCQHLCLFPLFHRGSSNGQWPVPTLKAVFSCFDR